MTWHRQDDNQGVKIDDMDVPLNPEELAGRLAHVYAALGPVYRKVARIVEGDEPVNRMSVGVRAVMEHLNREGERTVPQIAGSQEISRQFVQRMANDAHDAGFVEFVDNPAHRRSRLLRLTAGGRAAIREVVAREHQLMGRVGGDLTSRELDATLRVLHHMKAALDDVGGASEVRGTSAPPGTSGAAGDGGAG